MNNTELICAVIRGLFGRVTPNLRAVYVNFKDETSVLTFYYDKEPTEDEVELASLTDTEFMGDFPDDFKSDCKVLTLPYPEKIPRQGLGIYQRYEG